MKATPSKTSVAREFLTSDAQRRWTPESSIITYAELGDPVGDLEVSLTMTGIEEYDDRGAWQRSRPDQTMQFELASEDGEWRIDGLPDALIVPRSWFEDWFRQVALYLFDPTGQIFVPEPVFIPAGDTVASSMVDGLLDDPTADPRLSRTFVPPDFTSGVSVPITSAGIAEVSLEGNPADVDEEVSQRILTQLIWTMRQEPRIRAVQLTIGDEEQGLPGVATQVSLDVGAAYDPTGASASGDLFALLDGRVVRARSAPSSPPTARWAPTASACAPSVSTSRATRSPASPATAGACWWHRSTAKDAPSRWPAARRTSCRRRGTSPTGSGWPTAPVGER